MQAIVEQIQDEKIITRSLQVITQPVAALSSR